MKDKFYFDILDSKRQKILLILQKFNYKKFNIF